MIGIIGQSGFIGSNLSQRHETAINLSRLNLDQFNDVHFKTIFVCAPSGRKFEVDSNPNKDLEDVMSITEKLGGIKRIDNLVLFSTVDVFVNPSVSFESSLTLTNASYGGNRSFMEHLLRDCFGDTLTIARLCGLFGPYMVKNILFDFKMRRMDQLKKYNPTSQYQYMDINLALDIALSSEFRGCSVNVVSEPISISEIGIPKSMLDSSAPRIVYDIKTNFRDSGYFIDRLHSLIDLERFLNE
jgi:nucleoside-diphosphate-sugar epimerase